MELVAFEDVCSFKSGFYSNIPLSGNQDSLDVVLEGKNCVFSGLGQLESWKGVQSIGSGAPNFLQLVGDDLGGLDTGSAIMFRGKSIWFVGSGEVFYSDLDTSLDTASSTLKFFYDGDLYNAGLAAPSAPTVAVALDVSSVPVVGDITGTVSVRITRYRSATGAESSSSEASEVITPRSGQITVTFPSANVSESQDQWGIYLTRQGFGAEGPHFLWQIINESDLNGDREYTLTFLDADLLNILAPRNLSAPPAATHVVNLGDMIVLVGTEGGVAVLPSLPGYPEQFDLTLTAFLQPTEPVIRVDTRPSDGTVYIWTRNSLQTIIETGNDTAPILTRAIWPNTGILGQAAACLTETGAYAFSGRQGLVRTSGYADPDTSFALPVQNYVRNWNPDDVVMGYDPASSSVICGHQREMLVYNQANNLWSTPLQLEDFLEVTTPQTRILSAATKDGELYLSIGDGTTNKLYKYGVGVGGDWYARTLHRSAGAYGWNKWIRSWRLHGDFTDSTYATGVIDNNSLTRITDGYRAVDTNGSLYLEETIPAVQMADNEPYVEFTCPESTSTGSIRLFVGPALNSYDSRDLTTGTAGVFYVDVNANGSISLNGSTVISSGTVQVDYKVRVQRKQSASKWRIVVYNTANTQVASHSFNTGTDITGSGVGFKFTLNTGSGLTKYIKNIYLSGSPDSTSALKLYRSYGTIASDTESYTQSNPTVYPWKKLNIRDAVTYQLEVSGRGAGQRAFSIALNGYVRPVRS